MALFNLKKGDEVRVLAGKDKGKSGKVLEAFPKDREVVVEGINIKVRFQRAKRANEKGQRMELPAPMPSSKVMLLCPHCGKPTRVAHEHNQQGNFRKCRQCGRTL
ncbi:MAG: 50S ribosomal protein L24 [Acidobacteriaceae bacterium]